MSTILHDTFTDTDQTALASHTAETGTYSNISGGPFKIYNSGGNSRLGCYDGTAQADIDNGDIAADINLTISLFVGTATIDPGYLDFFTRTNGSLTAGYLFHITRALVKIFWYDGGGPGWTEIQNISNTLTPGVTYTVVIISTNAQKAIKVNGTTIATTANNATAYASGQKLTMKSAGEAFVGDGLFQDELLIATATTTLTAPTPGIINSTYAGWDTGTGSATSVSHNAVGVDCPTPTTGTAPYTFQWQKSTTSGSGFSNVTGAINQTQLISGLTANTTYFFRCVITDAIPNTATTTELTTTTATAAPAAAFVLIGDSTGTARANAAKNALNTDLGVATCVAVGCAKSGTRSTDWLSSTSNLKFAVICARAWGEPLNFCLGINDGESSATDLATFSANVDGIISYVTGQGVHIILHYVLFNNTGGGSGTTFNALIDTYNTYFDGKINGTTILKGDKQNKNYLSHHTDQMTDALHPNGTGIVSTGTRCARAYGWRTGKITPTLVLGTPTGNVYPITGTFTGWDDGTPGHPTLTISTGTISTQTLPDLAGAGSITTTALSFVVTDPDSGAATAPTPPTLLTVTVDPTGLMTTAAYSKTVAVNNADEYTIHTTASAGVTLTSPTGSGDDSTWVFTNSRAIFKAETLTLNFAGTGTVDTSANPLATITGKAVVNNSAVICATPLNLAVVGGNTVNNLSWTPNTEPVLGGYKIYHATTLTGSYTLLQTVSAPTFSYQHTGLTNGDSAHFYKISSIDTAGSPNESSKSAGVQGTPEGLTVPTGLVATPGAGSVTLNWAVIDPAEDGVRIERSTDATTYFAVHDKSADGTSYTDDTAVAGTAYFYRIRTFTNSPAAQSDPSNVAGPATPTAGDASACACASDLPLKSLVIWQGETWNHDEGTHRTISKGFGETWPTDLTGYTITSTITKTAANVNAGTLSTLAMACTVAQATGVNQSFYIETGSNTANLPIGEGTRGYDWYVKAVKGSVEATLRAGVASVKRRL